MLTRCCVSVSHHEINLNENRIAFLFHLWLFSRFKREHVELFINDKEKANETFHLSCNE